MRFLHEQTVSQLWRTRVKFCKWQQADGGSFAVRRMLFFQESGEYKSVELEKTKINLKSNRLGIHLEGYVGMLSSRFDLLYSYFHVDFKSLRHVSFSEIHHVFARKTNNTSLMRANS
jgi:hypothetical protein